MSGWEHRHLDVPGAFLVTAGLIALVSTVIGARTAVLLQASPHAQQSIQNALVGDFQAGVFVCAGCALLAALIAIFTLHEHRTPAGPAQLPEAEHCHCARPVAFALNTRSLDQACVQACPTGAAIRIQPTKFFGSTEEILRRRTN